MNSLRKQQQLNLVLIALAFFTRIPIPDWVDFSQKKLSQASRYFSLIGWIVGGLCAIVLCFFSVFLPTSTAILLSMVFSVLLTGCFHEDGLADTCDGFGGGWEKQQKLSIMKDSRLGTYGAAAIWFSLSLKFLLLVQVEQQTQSAILLLLVAHTLSRSLSTLMIFCLPYVTDEEQSKVKPLAEKMKRKDLAINIVIAGLSLILVPQWAVAIVLMIIFCFIGLKILMQKQIGGFTGDTLGASQQISEIAIYLTVVAITYQSTVISSIGEAI